MQNADKADAPVEVVADIYQNRSSIQVLFRIFRHVMIAAVINCA